jgi:glucose-1-phosphate cytidylyltransferase
MKVVILAGGLGTRLTEETQVKPKPMVEIGGQPILWHIMKSFAVYGFKEFIIALGYKGELIKEYFINYHHRNHNLTVSLSSGEITVRNGDCEDWTVHLLDTGLHTQTGGRVKQAAEFIGNEPFFLTYGDGVSNININKLLAFHCNHGKLATVSAVRPPSRFGGISLDGDQVAGFEEKPQIGEGWINGGFFVFEPQVREYLNDDSSVLERQPMERLSREGQLMAYRHPDFWACMDTLRDVQLLQKLWADGQAPWKVW